jgi:hypothetical protein
MPKRQDETGWEIEGGQTATSYGALPPHVG